MSFTQGPVIMTGRVGDFQGSNGIFFFCSEMFQPKIKEQCFSRHDNSMRFVFGVQV